MKYLRWIIQIIFTIVATVVTIVAIQNKAAQTDLVWILLALFDSTTLLALIINIITSTLPKNRYMI